MRLVIINKTLLSLRRLPVGNVDGDGGRLVEGGVEVLGLDDVLRIHLRPVVDRIEAWRQF